jgi:hypothetical protein
MVDSRSIAGAVCSTMEKPESPPPGLESLRDLPATLHAATTLIHELRDHPEFARMVALFSAIPPTDRRVILTAIEKEVEARRLSLATEDVTGQSMHPSPNARLYLRSHERDLSRLPIDRDDMMLAMLAAMRASVLLVGDLHATWLGAVRDAIGHIDATLRASVTALVRDALGALEDPNVPNES